MAGQLIRSALHCPALHCTLHCFNSFSSTFVSLCSSVRLGLVYFGFSIQSACRCIHWPTVHTAHMIATKRYSLFKKYMWLQFPSCMNLFVLSGLSTNIPIGFFFCFHAVLCGVCERKRVSSRTVARCAFVASCCAVGDLCAFSHLRCAAVRALTEHRLAHFSSFFPLFAHCLLTLSFCYCIVILFVVLWTGHILTMWIHPFVQFGESFINRFLFHLCLCVVMFKCVYFNLAHIDSLWLYHVHRFVV